MNLFRTKPKESADKPQDDRAVIERKLSECTAELRAADNELARTSLATFHSGDNAASIAALDRLHELQAQHEILTATLVEAERVEQERQRGLRAQQNVSAKRAMSQHAGRFQRDAADVARAIADLRDAPARMQSSAASIVAVCPSHLRTPANPYHELLSPSGLAGRIAVESYRLNRHGKPPAPGFEYEDRRTGAIAPMVETLFALVAMIREDFDGPPPKEIAPLKIAIGDGADAPGVAGDRCASPPVAGNPVAAQTHSGALGHQGRLTGVAVNASTGQMVELTERYAPGEQDGSEQARSAVVKAAVEAAGEDMAAPIERSAHGAVDYTKLF